MIQVPKKTSAVIRVPNEVVTPSGNGIPNYTTDPTSPAIGDEWFLQTTIVKPLQAVFGGFPINSTDTITSVELKVKINATDIYKVNLTKQ